MRASERWFLQGIIRHYDLFLFVSVCARYKFMAEMTIETLDVCASWFEIMSFGDTVEDRVHLWSCSSQFSGRGRGGSVGGGGGVAPAVWHDSQHLPFLKLLRRRTTEREEKGQQHEMKCDKHERMIYSC